MNTVEHFVRKPIKIATFAALLMFSHALYAAGEVMFIITGGTKSELASWFKSQDSMGFKIHEFSHDEFDVIIYVVSRTSGLISSEVYVFAGSPGRRYGLVLFYNLTLKAIRPQLLENGDVRFIAETHDGEYEQFIMRKSSFKNTIENKDQTQS